MCVVWGAGELLARARRGRRLAWRSLRVQLSRRAAPRARWWAESISTHPLTQPTAARDRPVVGGGARAGTLAFGRGGGGAVAHARRGRRQARRLIWRLVSCRARGGRLHVVARSPPPRVRGLGRCACAAASRVCSFVALYVALRAQPCSGSGVVVRVRTTSLRKQSVAVTAPLLKPRCDHAATSRAPTCAHTLRTPHNHHAQSNTPSPPRPHPPPPSFWKRVSNLDRAETKRYLEALYVLKMRWAGGAFVGLGVGVG